MQTAKDELKVQTRSLEISNVSSLPLTVSLALKHPFKILMLNGKKVEGMVSELFFWVLGVNKMLLKFTHMTTQQCTEEGATINKLKTYDKCSHNLSLFCMTLLNKCEIENKLNFGLF